MIYKMLRLRLLNFFLILLVPAFAIANPADTLPEKKIFKTSIRYFYEKDFIYGNVYRFSIDTSPTVVHHVNPAMDLHHNYLSTLGSASMPQVFGINNGLYTFTSIHSYDLQMLHSDSIRSYRTNKRFTEIDYHNSAFKEQKIAITHTQNITKNWNAGFYFNRQGVGDFMNYSDTYRSRFALFTWYSSPNKKYNLFANAIWNTVKNGVNGGLKSDSLFDNTVVSNLGIKGLAYQISEAEQHIRKKGFTLSHYLDIGKTETDSSGNILHRKPPLRLHHRLTLERKSFVYLDNNPDSGYYSDFNYGEVTYDSLHSDEVKNRFSIQFPADTSYNSAFFRNWSSGLFSEYQYINYGQNNDSSWNNLSVGANVLLKSDSASAEAFAEAVYVISGFDKENYRLDLRAYSPYFKFGKFGAQLLVSKSSPDFMYRWYDSNNFFWKNNFSKSDNFITAFIYDLPKYHFRIHAKHIIIDNYVYMNNEALPKQYSGSITIEQVSVTKNFVFRNWHFDNTIVFQESEDENIIHLPEFISDQSLYYESSFFKKALYATFGIAANYNSFYFADAYMPASSMFYYQSTTKTGGYPIFDLFINAKIKTARIFIKFENAADGLFGDSYYLTPHYPMPGRVLKFGLVWQFYDQ